MRALSLATLLFATQAWPVTPVGRFDRAGWIKDYQLVKVSMERSYSHLAWVASPESGIDLPALDKRATQALQRAQSDEEAEAAITSFLRAFRDGHLGFNAPSAPAVADAGTPEPEPPARDSEETAAGACAALGYAPVTRLAFSLPFESLKGFTLEADGMSQPFRSGVIVVGARKVGIVRIARFRAAEYPAVCEEAWKQLRAQSPKVTAGDLSNAIDAAWLRALAARLTQFRKDAVDVVIVDVGGNGGGNDLGDWAVRVFTAQPVHSAKLLVIPGPGGTAYLDEHFNDVRTKLDAAPDLNEGSRDAGVQELAMLELAKKRAAEPPCDMSWVWTKRRAWSDPGCKRLVEAGFMNGLDYAPPNAFDPRIASALYWAVVADPFRGAWDGPVFVLTDDRTGSSAEMFAALMHDGARARSIGLRTMGLGCGFMAKAIPVTLPHSHFALTLPNCVRLRSDGTDEVAGIFPDDPVGPLPGESGRARAARALGVVAASLAAKAP